MIVALFAMFSDNRGRYSHLLPALLTNILCLGVVAGLTTARAADLDVKTVIADLALRESAIPLRDTPDWKPPKKIIVNVQRHPERLAWFQQVVKDPNLVPVNSEREAIVAMAANPDADALVGFQCGERAHPNPAAVEMIKKAVAGKKVRWIQISAAGVEGCAALPEARDSKILFSSMQGAQGGLIAEHTMGLLLYLTRQLDLTRRQQQEEVWANPPKVVELHGKTLLILGLGGNGLEVASRARAFGMKIIATRNTGRDHPDYVEYVGGPDETDKLAAQADVIVASLPLTPETTHMFNAAFFGKLKPTAYFLNIGRGESVVTDDLIAALTTNRLAGAGLDVTDPEPLPKGHPLWKAPNLIISPHNSTSSEVADDRRQTLLREQMRRFAVGEKMLMVVDLKRGY